MPINVFKITKGKKNRPTITPGIVLHRDLPIGMSGSSIVKGIKINESSIHYNFDKDVYSKMSSVYTAGEINSKLSDISKSIDTLKVETNTDIAKSLGQIQASLKSLKQDILNSKTFKEKIKAEILQELKDEI